MDLKSLSYSVSGRVATLTLNRPQRMNAIDPHMPGEIRRCVEMADANPEVHVIILTGRGENFCSGYDLKIHAENKSTSGTQEMPWDSMVDYRWATTSNVF
jgi:enoyl-CoA hydratase